MKIYDIVIPLKSGSHDNYTELKFALRSIEKYLTGYDQIHLVTDMPPSWGTMMHLIPVKDVPNRKQFSLMKKLWFACNLDRWVSDDFVYWHDDHYLLKPIHVNDIEPYYDQDLKQALSEASGRYHTAILNTINLLGEKAKYFDIHVPCVFNKKKISELYSDNWPEYGYVVKSLYFNTYKVEGTPLKDLVIRRPVSIENIENRINGHTFFATNTNSVKTQMIKKLNQLFPNKSKYEL